MKQSGSTLFVNSQKAKKINIDGKEYWECILDQKIIQIKMCEDAHDCLVRIAPHVEVDCYSGQIIEYLVADFNS